MKAYRLFSDGMRFDDVPVPQPSGRQVLLRVAGTGLCHSDLHVEAAVALGKGAWAEMAPFTLGHEIAGFIEAAGPEAHVAGIEGPVAVYCAWGCGSCFACRNGSDNYCEDWTGLRGAGLGYDGGLAPYVLVPDARYLVPLGDLEPCEAAPLADAGLTAYHAVSRSRHALERPGATALVIGVGGLGHLAVQVLRATTDARIIALDVSREKLALARELGADAALESGDGVLQQIVETTGGRRVDAVLDFVGTQQTMDVARKAVRPGGEISLVGLAGGALPMRQGSVPYGARASIPFYGTIADLHATVALAQSGRLKARVERYPLERTAEAFDAMRGGRLEGRAVIFPAE